MNPKVFVLMLIFSTPAFSQVQGVCAFSGPDVFTELYLMQTYPELSLCTADIGVKEELCSASCKQTKVRELIKSVYKAQLGGHESQWIEQLDSKYCFFKCVPAEKQPKPDEKISTEELLDRIKLWSRWGERNPLPVKFRFEEVTADATRIDPSYAAPIVAGIGIVLVAQSIWSLLQNATCVIILVPINKLDEWMGNPPSACLDKPMTPKDGEILCQADEDDEDIYTCEIRENDMSRRFRLDRNVPGVTLL